MRELSHGPDGSVTLVIIDLHWDLPILFYIMDFVFFTPLNNDVDNSVFIIFPS